jgi:hypothetical protein
VRPPNTTIPKTDAALPNNQYATDLELIFGKCPGNGITGSTAILREREANGEILLILILGGALMVFSRTLLYDVDFGKSCRKRVAGEACLTFMQGWHAKKFGDSRGTARRIPGSSEAIALLEQCVGRRGEKDGNDEGDIGDGTISGSSLLPTLNHGIARVPVPTSPLNPNLSSRVLASRQISTCNARQ